MKYKVLLIENNATNMRVLKRVIGKANLDVVTATSLLEAKARFKSSTPESYLCAVIDYNLPDAPNGEAIDFAIASYVPVIVIASRTDDDIRDHILSKPVVDYIPRQNAQIFEYLSQLLARLQKNKFVGVLVVDAIRKQRQSISSLLNRHNFITYEALSGESAIELLQEHNHIKLMICDEKLPDISGVDLVANVRRTYSPSELSIIGTATGAQSSLLAKFIKSGASDFLSKPYCHEAFFCRVLQNVEQIEQIEFITKTANADYLTGIPNRRHFLSQVIALMKRGLDSQCLALLDLDYFKAVNDKYGHDYGDAVLKETAKLISKHFAGFPISRFGGEEFCVFLPNIELSVAEKMMNDFRVEFAEKHVKFRKKTIACTVSIGLTSKCQKKLESMLTLADEYLYKAKARGRNIVVSDNS